MAGRVHAAGYRSATALYDAGLPEVRLVAVADVNAEFAADTARRFGYQRAEPGWEAVAAAPDVDVVSVVVANPLHRPIVEGCWPPASTSSARSRWPPASRTPRR
jgi:predicted dehydrogenase